MNALICWSTSACSSRARRWNCATTNRYPLAVAQRGTQVMPVFCRFDVGSAKGFTGSIPQQLNSVAAEPASPPDMVRNLTIMQLSRPSDYPSITMSLNNLRFTDSDIELPRQGAVEQWNLINITTEPHPIHLHLVAFRVVGRQSLDTAALMQRYPVPDLGGSGGRRRPRNL